MTSSFIRHLKPSRFRCLTALVFLVVTLGAAPVGEAQTPNGNYNISGGRGSLSSDGQTIVIPSRFLKEIGNQGGVIVVRKNRLLINRNGTADVLRAILAGVGTRIQSVKVTGPAFVQLSRSGPGFAGKTKVPIKTQMKGIDDSGDPFTVNLTTYVTATVMGRNIRLNTRFAGGNSEARVEGNITLNGAK